MSRQLNLRVSDEFAKRLERIARSTGRPMAAVLEALGTPVLDAAEEDARFEAEALAAWEEYQLRGASVTAAALASLFDDARVRTVAPTRRRSR